MIRSGDGGTYLDVHVQPGARRPGVVGLHGDRLKVAVSAPAAGGRANQAVIEAVAELLGVKSSAVALVAGRTSRHKGLFITGLTVKEAVRRIGNAVAG